MVDIQEQFIGFLRAQFLSICNTTTGLLATLMASQSIEFPIFLSFLNYCLLFLVYGIFFKGISLSNCFSKATELFRSFNCSSEVINLTNLKTLLHSRYFAYLFVALIDVEASVIVLTGYKFIFYNRWLILIYTYLFAAFQYTSIASITLLDAWAIPSTMILSYLFLGASYQSFHFYGILMAILGLFLNVLSDSYNETTGSGGESAVFGDALCLVGFTLYAVSNVMQEYLVKYCSRKEYLSLLGLWGALISMLQCFASGEYRVIISSPWNVDLLLLVGGYVLFLFLFYVNGSIVLQRNDSTYFNLSLLTSDIYALIATYFLLNSSVHWLYFLSFACVVIGLIVYHAVDSPTERGLPLSVDPLSSDSKLTKYEEVLTTADEEEDDESSGKGTPSTLTTDSPLHREQEEVSLTHLP